MGAGGNGNNPLGMGGNRFKKSFPLIPNAHDATAWAPPRPTATK